MTDLEREWYGDNQETMRPALERIVSHVPRQHQGRSRNFVNWQNAYWELQTIAKNALKEWQTFATQDEQSAEGRMPVSASLGGNAKADSENQLANMERKFSATSDVAATSVPSAPRISREEIEQAVIGQRARKNAGELDVTITIDAFLDLCDAALRTVEAERERDVVNASMRKFVNELGEYASKERCEICSGAGCIGIPGASCPACDGAGKNKLALAFKWLALMERAEAAKARAGAELQHALHQEGLKNREAVRADSAEIYLRLEKIKTADLAQQLEQAKRDGER